MISFPSEKPPAQHGILADLCLVFLASGVFLIGFILWLDNAQGSLTGNGIFKSMELQQWVTDPATAQVFPSNFLFYPAYGALCRLLDAIGVFADDPRRQMAVLNALSASFCLCAVYALAFTLTRDRLIAALTALFHISCNYVFVLGIVNEDIMSSYTLLFASMALAAVWFAKPTAFRVIVVSIVFSFGWLFEWRLMFPTLPAMLVALWLCEPRLARRFLWMGLLLAGVLGMAVATAWIWRNHPGAPGAMDLLWTGKGVGTMWGGFTWPKVEYLRDGIAGYLLGTGFTTLPNFPGWDVMRYSAISIMVAVLAVSLPMMWRRRADPRVMSMAMVFGGTLVAGQVFNLYSQPHDPQMQLNVMAWLSVGWMLALLAAQHHWGRAGLGALGGASLVFLAYNIWSLVPVRGEDTAWKQAIERLETHADPSKTAFVLHDFGWVFVHTSFEWKTSTPAMQGIDRAPQPEPRLKWIGFVYPASRRAEITDAEHVAELRQQIDRALDLGYDVVATRVWDMDVSELMNTAGMVLDLARVTAVHKFLHTAYTATPLYTDPVAGPFYRLQRAR